MRIAVISDTHLQNPSNELERVFDRFLEPADAVLHCGDLVGENTLAYLQTHPRFYAVCGNMDFGTVAAHLPASRVVDLDGRRVGMVHNPGCLVTPGRLRLVDPFPREVDLVCCGHLHERMWMRLPDGTRLLNPGSLFLPRDSRPGLAILEWKDDQPSVEWIDLS